jgi:hypothetical protein
MAETKEIVAVRRRLKEVNNFTKLRFKIMKIIFLE